MFKQTLLISAMALTISGCMPEGDIKVIYDIGQGNPTETEQPTNSDNSPVTDSTANDNTQNSEQPNTATPSDPSPTQPTVPDTTAPDNTGSNTTTPDTSAPDNSGSNTTTPDTSTPDNTAQDDSNPDNTSDQNNDSNASPNDTSNSDSSSLASAYIAGNSYVAGDVVSNQGKNYQCLQAGWCSSGHSFYEPGKGLYWEQAWTSAGAVTDNSGSANSGTTQPPVESPNGSSDSANNSGSNTGTTPPAEDSNTQTPSDGYTTSLSLDGWPKPLQEKNKPYQNTSGKVVGTYFVEWGVYGRDYHVADIPAQNITHILYGFIPICGPNESMRAAGGTGYQALQQQCAGKQDYEVVIHDEWAALGIAYPGDTWDQPVKGNFGQLMRMKATHPDITILPSIGGWTLSDPFFDLGNDQNRAVFVNSVKDFILEWDFFGGVDIDWEYPTFGGANPSLGDASDTQTYTILMRDLRAMLDDVERETGRDMQLTSAIGAAPKHINAVDYQSAQHYMDYIFMMSYDYKGAWSSELGHQTNLYNSQLTDDQALSVQTAVNLMLSQNVAPEKLVVGVAKYGRGWANISGANSNNPFLGTGGGALNEAGYWEPGIMDYKLIEQRYLGGNPNGSGVNGWSAGWDDVAQAPYLWNETEGKLITYDNPRSIKAKGNYVLNNNLGGLFSWEIDGDNGTLLNAMHEALGH